MPLEMNDRVAEELYPCGVRVNVLSLGVRKTKLRSPALGNKKLSARLRSSQKDGNVAKHHIKLSSKRNSISDMLKMKIHFTDDIVERYCPETMTYNKAKEKLSTFIHKRDRKHSLQQERRTEITDKARILPRRRTQSETSKGQSLRLHKSSRNHLNLPDDKPVYLPVLQTVFPKPLSEWADEDQLKAPPTSSKRLDRITLGSRRWTSLPIRAPTPPELRVKSFDDGISEGPSGEDMGRSHSLIGRSQSLIGRSQSLMINTDTQGLHDNDEDLETAAIANTDSITVKQLLLVFHKLMSSWKIFVQPQHLNIPFCSRCLSNPSGGKQLYGLYISRKLFLQPLLSPVLATRKSNESVGGVARIDDDILEQITNLLEAETERVRVAAAILLHCMYDGLTDNNNSLKNRINHTLLSSISSSSHSERWSAVQSVAITGVCNMGVVTVLFDYYCNSRNESDKEKSLRLLVELSSSSKLVVSLLAEKLNSKCWNERRSTCVLFPLLQHPLNKDVTDRILNSSLRDWNPQVRLTAAQALGKTNNGKMVHDAIKDDLANSDEITKLNALKRIHLLGLMTATLLPLFVKCFKDDHNSIKLEAISIAEDLVIMDESVTSALTHSLQDDCWKVKAHAIKAVGTLKIVSERVISHLLWAARFEQLPEVRAQVCNTLGILGIKNDQIVLALKAILNVEDNELVLSEASKCLKMMGEDATPFDQMLDIVCAEVKSLSTKDGILNQIVATEKSEFVNDVLLKQKTKLQRINDQPI